MADEWQTRGGTATMVAIPRYSDGFRCSMAVTDPTPSLDADARTTFGKRVSKLRRAGITPIHVYGHGEGPLSLQVDTYALVTALAQVGYTTPLTVRVAGGEHLVVVREVQRHPVTEHLLHVDLIRVSRSERIEAAVPLVMAGEAPAGRIPEVSVVQDLHELLVRALPMAMPHELTIDLASLSQPDTALHARDIPLPLGVELVTEPDHPVVRATYLRTAPEEETSAPEPSAPTAPPA